MDAPSFLAQVRARLTRVLVLEGAARVLLIAISLLLLLVVADYCWPTPGWFRCAALLALLATVAVGARPRRGRPLRQAMDHRSLAQFVERRLPGLDGRLLTWIDGIALGQEAAALEQVLVPSAVRTLVPARRLPRWLAGAGTALAAVLLSFVLWPRFCQDACGRMFLPLGGTQWARGNTIKAELDRSVVAADRKLQVAIERHYWRSGVDQPGFEAPVVVSWLALDGIAAGRHDGRQLPGMRGHQWTTSLPDLPPGHWRISIESGDAEPVLLEARSVARPSLVGISALLTPPAYVHLKPQHLATLACSALPGSQLAMQLRFAAEPGSTIASAEGAVTTNGQSTPLQLQRSGEDFSGTLAIRPGAALGLALRAVDQDGIALDPPASFAVSLIVDHPPTVSLSGPASAESVSAHAVVWITVDASDDYALAKLELHGQNLPGHAPGTEAPASKGPLATIEAFADVADTAATTRHALVTVGKLAGPRRPARAHRLGLRCQQRHRPRHHHLLADPAARGQRRVPASGARPHPRRRPGTHLPGPRGDRWRPRHAQQAGRQRPRRPHPGRTCGRTARGRAAPLA